MSLLDNVELDKEVGKKLLGDIQGFGDEQVTDLIAFLEQKRDKIPKLVKVNGWLSFIATPIIRRQVQKLVIQLIVLLIKLKTLLQEQKGVMQ